MRYGSLDEATARQIVQRTMNIIQHSVNVMDSSGTIIASGDPSRIYQRHEGAVLALTENRIVEIDSATANHLKGVKPGINLPFGYKNQNVGVVGVSGTPDKVRAYAELVKMAAELILEQAAVISDQQREIRYREELANQLISEHYDPSTVEAMSAYLNIDLTQPRVVFILETKNNQAEQIKAILSYFSQNDHQYLVTLTQLNQLVLIKPIMWKNDEWNVQQERKQIQLLFTRLQPFQISRIISGGYFDGKQGIHYSYMSAKATQNMTQRISSKSKFLFYHEHALPVLLGSLAQGWQVKELTKNWESLIKNDPKGILQTTLKHYFEQNCDLAQTAKMLHIHINTLRYRLQKIEAITHSKINELQCLIWLYIGMKVHC